MNTDQLTEEDLKLVNALQVYPRISWSALSQILGTSPITLSRRWRTLEENGLAWVTCHSISSTKERVLVLADVRVDPSQLQYLLQKFSADPRIASVETSTGNHDVLLTIDVANFPEFADVVLEQLLKMPGVFSVKSSLVTQLHSSGDSWRLQNLSKKQIEDIEALKPSFSPRIQRENHTQVKVEQELVLNGRRTAAEIAEKYDIHPTTAQRAITRIERNRTLTFRCEVAQRAAGYPIHCNFYTRIPAQFHPIAAAKVKQIKEVRMCASTSGENNFLITMWLRTIDEVLVMERQLLQAVPQMDIRECSFALHVHKRVGQMLNIDGSIATMQA